MRVIKLRLTPESADEALKEVQSYRDHIIKVARELVETLVSTGVDYAKIKVYAYGAYETGDLLNSIEGFFDPATNKGIIKADSKHAAFVEYGTGIVGATNKSHEPKPYGWQHDVNNHGDEGWFYANGRWTKGLMPRPFMWDTWQMLCEDASDLVRRSFND